MTVTDAHGVACPSLTGIRSIRPNSCSSSTNIVNRVLAVKVAFKAKRPHRKLQLKVDVDKAHKVIIKKHDEVEWLGNM